MVYFEITNIRQPWVTSDLTSNEPARSDEIASRGRRKWNRPAKITVQIVDRAGHAHPVQFGTSKKNVTNHPFRGAFRDFVVWHASTRGVPFTFRITVPSDRRST